MDSEKTLIRKIIYLSGIKKGGLISVLCLFLMQALIEMIGVGLIAPYIAVIISYEQSLLQFSWFFDLFSKSYTEIQVITTISYALILIFSLKLISSIIVQYFIINFVQEKRLNLACRLFKSYQHMPYLSYKNKNSSEYIHRIQTLTYDYSNTVLAPLLKVTSDFIVGASLISLLFLYNPTVFISLISVMAVVIIGFDTLTKHRVKTYGELCNTNAERMIKYTKEAIGGLKEIRILGVESFFYEQFQKSLQIFTTYAKRIQIFTIVPRLLFEWCLIFFLVAAVLIGIGDPGQRMYLVSSLGIFAIAAIRILPMVNQLSSALLSIRASKNSIDILHADCFERNIKSDEKNVQVSEEFNSLEFSNVSFSYSENQTSLLKNVNLVIKRGQMIGVVGPSGSGKSTFLELMMGLLEPSFGLIQLNGKKLTTDRIQSWHKKLGYLSQKVFIADSTVVNNVALGVSDYFIDQDLAVSSLKRVNLLDNFNKNRDPLNTLVGEAGEHLSGGQAQRVGIARALYHGRDFLIFDEATSALDQAVEEKIVAEINKLRGKATIIIATHKHSNLKECDVIYGVENGVIQTIGTYSDLVSMVRSSEIS